MVETIKNKRLSVFIFAGMFSVLAFLIQLAALSDVIDDFIGISITEEVESVANYLVLIYGVAILFIVIIANIISDVKISIATIGSVLSFLLSLLILYVISYLSINTYYPEFFIRPDGSVIQIYDFEAILNFSGINTTFAIYIIRNTNVFFIIELLMILFLSFAFVSAMKGYPAS